MWRSRLKPDSSMSRPWKRRSSSATSAVSLRRAGVLHLLHERVERRDLLRRGGVADPLDGLGLDERAQLVDRVHLVLGQARDDGAAMRERLDQALLLQLAHRLADGRAADAHLRGHVRLQEARAGGDLG